MQMKISKPNGEHKYITQLTRSPNGEAEMLQVTKGYENDDFCKVHMSFGDIWSSECREHTHTQL